MTRPALRSALLSALLAAAPLATGCIDRSITAVPPIAESTEQLDFRVVFDPALDLLFVVDDSGSMKREQDQIIENFHRMIAVLETLPGGLPDLHLGVVSTDVGGGESCGAPSVPAGVLRNQPRIPGCSPPTDRWIVDVEDGAGGRRRNYAGALHDAFACVAALGTSGCGFEQPLEAMRRALSPATTENAGFLRPGALLAVVLLTDEDDCSVFDDGLFDRSTAELGPVENFRCFQHGITCDGVPATTLGPRENCVPRDDSPYLVPIDEYVAFLHDLRPAGDLLVAGIMGDPGPIEIVRNERGNLDVGRSCAIDAVDQQGAFPPIRTDAFLARLPRPIRERICDADLSPAMTRIAAEIVADLYGGCLQGDLADAAPDVPGVQPDCSVTEIQRPGAPDERHTILPACDAADPADATNRPCWAIQPDELCTAAHRLRIVVHYPPDGLPERTTRARAECRTR